MLVDILQNIMLALIQGLTEVFPISSSGHLIVYGLVIGQEVSFNTVLLFHFGTFLAILFFYRKDVVDILTGKMGWKITGFMFISFSATALVGWIVEETFTNLVMEQPQYVAVLWFINGLTVAFIGFLSKPGIKKITDLNMREYIIIGIAQGIAAIPGISRLGLTLGAGLLQKMTWFEALKLSFLLSLPTIFAASLVKSLQFFNIGVTDILSLAIQSRSIPFKLATGVLSMSHMMMATLITLTTLICCLIAINFMRRFLGRRLLFYFGLYCVTAGTFFWLYFALP